jgi:pyruvyl transferase EpsO
MERPDEGVLRLRARLLATVAEALPAPPDRWGFMPLPLHGNVGESAMVLGAFALLGELGWPPPTVISDIETFEPSSVGRRLRGGPIVIGGGGNFGDLWPREHAIRLRILRELPDVPVIQLPQSVHFGTERTRDETAAALQGRSGVTLLVRDRRSLATLQEALGDQAPVLCPDIAFALGLLDRGEPDTDLVRLIRRDHESRLDEERRASVGGIDWVEEGPAPPIMRERRLRDLGLRWPWLRPLTDRAREGLHLPMARTRLERGLGLLRRGRVIVTDRMHAHILCLMLGIPHVLIGDRHGKIEGFVESWTAGLPGFRLVESFAGADVQASALLRSSGA